MIFNQLGESVHSCCHKLVAEVQLDTPIKMLNEEALCLERNKLQLFDECSPRNMSKSVDVYGAAMNLCVWDPGISSKLKALIDYALNTQQRYELVVRKSKVDDTYSDVNRVFDDSFQRAASMAYFIVLELHNFSTLAELKGLVGAQGDKIIVCPPTFSLYEVVALQTCQNDHGSLYVIESELELVKVTSIIVAYVVHKAILIFKALNNVGAIQIKFSSHNGIFVEIQFAKLGKTYGVAMRPSLTERSSAFIIIILEQNHHCFFLPREVLMEINKMCRMRVPEAFSYIKRSYCLAGITDAHDTPNIKKVMEIVGLSKT
ncbi:hypothetical protein FXO38_04026 [Capsicum annuum]|nr:hypothetical protein FXO38_04026 [Capsicum annuum]KAF3679382.1 hypothetical protein FXO37_03889 [Capsicum annuum]